MKKEYEELINSIELEDAQKLVLKMTWLEYLKSCNKNAWNGWWNHHIFSILIIILGVFIPLLDNSDLKTTILGVKFGPAGILGIIIAIATGISAHWQFESRWKHYRLQAEIMRAEGEDFFALSNKYAKYQNHKEAIKEFIGIVTLFKRKEVEVYIKSKEDENNLKKNSTRKPK